MAPTTCLLLLWTLLLSVPATTHLQSNPPEGFISTVISNKGLDFIKDLLVNMALSFLTPLKLPRFEDSMKIPLLGRVDIVFSDLTIHDFSVSSSFAWPGKTGLTIAASVATANLTADWSYSYTTWWLPIEITDRSKASLQVDGMEIGLTLSLKIEDGVLRLHLLECGCSVKHVFIKLDGRASWHYQEVVDAFQTQIGHLVEESVSKKLSEGIIKLDSQLQNLPKEVKLNPIATLNVTVVNDPVFTDSSVGFEISGLFAATEKVALSDYNHHISESSDSCICPTRMVEVSLHQNVINSAAVVYFRGNVLTWSVNRILDQSLLNTVAWRFVVPQLYKKYPKDDMNLNIYASSPPIAKITDHDIDAAINLDITVNVLNDGEVIPVACIALAIEALGFAEISRNYIVGTVQLKNFTLALRWSKIGKVRMHLLQPLVSTLLKTVFMPYANSHLRRGFPLPTLYGFSLENAGILLADSKITVCSDVAFTELRAVKK